MHFSLSAGIMVLLWLAPAEIERTENDLRSIFEACPWHTPEGAVDQFSVLRRPLETDEASGNERHMFAVEFETRVEKLDDFMAYAARLTEVLAQSVLSGELQVHFNLGRF